MLRDVWRPSAGDDSGDSDDAAELVRMRQRDEGMLPPRGGRRETERAHLLKPKRAASYSQLEGGDDLGAPPKRRVRSQTSLNGEDKKPKHRRNRSRSIDGRTPPPLNALKRRANSILAEVEGIMSAHSHEVVRPKASVTVSTFQSAQNVLNAFSAFLALLAVLTLSCLYFTLVSKWSFTNALYFSVVTLTTVGYGDVTPATDGEKGMALLLFFLGAGVLGSFIGDAFSNLLDEAKDESSRLDPRKRLRRSLLLLSAWTITGTVCFYALEDVTLTTAVYWSAASLTTVGYGDVVPTSDVSKLFASGFILGGTFVCIHSLGSIAAIPLEAHRLQLRDAVLSQYGDTLTQEEFLELTRGELALSLEKIDRTTDSKRCTKTAFALAMLIKLGKCEIADVKACFDQFDRLDHNGNGFLELEDVELKRREVDEADDGAPAAEGASPRASRIDAARRQRCAAGIVRFASRLNKGRKFEDLLAEHPTALPSPTPLPPRSLAFFGSAPPEENSMDMHTWPRHARPPPRAGAWRECTSTTMTSATATVTTSVQRGSGDVDAAERFAQLFQAESLV
mmetsp:Transcript_7387/g.26350  ORF Transcript_7387/g.26350 Transcript_7387/m.26350 type:complete len:565 (+) Transcript_7387:241-1935(+)